MEASKHASLGNKLRNNQGDFTTDIVNGAQYNGVSTFKNIDNTVVSAYAVARNKGNHRVTGLHERKYSALKSRGAHLKESSQYRVENQKTGVHSDSHNKEQEKGTIDTGQGKKYAHLRKPPINRRKIPQPVSLFVSKLLTLRNETANGAESAREEVTNANETDLKLHGVKNTQKSEAGGEIQTYDTTEKITSGDSEGHTEVLANIEPEKVKIPENVQSSSGSRHLTLPPPGDTSSSKLVNRRKLPRVPLQRTSSPKVDKCVSDAAECELGVDTSCGSSQSWGHVDQMFGGVTPTSSIDFSETSETTDSSSVSYLNSSAKSKMEEGKDSCETVEMTTASGEDCVSDKAECKGLSNPVLSPFCKPGDDSESHSYLKKVNDKLKTNYVSKMANIEIASNSEVKHKKCERLESDSGRQSDSAVSVDKSRQSEGYKSDSVQQSDNDVSVDKSRHSEGYKGKNSCQKKSSSQCISNDPSKLLKQGEIVQNMDIPGDKQCVDSDISKLNNHGESLEYQEEEVAKLPQNLFFSFNNDVIQELTDGVLESERTEETELSQSETQLNLDYEAKSENVNMLPEIPQSDEKQVLKSPEDKASVEGMSVSGREVNSSHKADTSGDGLVNKPLQTHRQKVERSPSYRSRVMARAKIRYNKKSNKCKECSCTRNENGEITMCQFCEHFDMKMKRSHTSLGTVTHSKVPSEITDNESSEICSPRRTLTPGLPPLPSHDSPKSLRRVQVSPRMELLMSSGLFKKHLQKHEDLLNRHTMSYKRFGMRKSVSNLDLSDGYTVDSDLSQCDSEDPESRLDDETMETQQNMKTASLPRHNRRHSLTSESESSLQQYQRVKGFDTMPNSRTRSRPPIPNFQEYNGRSNHHYPIPSFKEFRSKNITREATLAPDLSGLKGTGTAAVTANASGKTDGSFEDHLNTNLNTIVETNSTENLLDIVQSDSKSELSENVHETISNTVHDNIVSKHGKEKSVQETKIKPVSARSRPVSKEPMKKQASTPNLFEKKPHRVRRKLKSRTLSQCETDTDSHYNSTGDLSLSDTCSSSQSPRRISGKRPRSLISKKSTSSLADNIPACNLDNDRMSQTQPVGETNQTAKVEQSLSRSKSDTNYETAKGKSASVCTSAKSKGGHTRHLSLLDKGGNYVNLDHDDTVSQCSNQDVGESESSTSFANSTVSDSIASEVVNEDNSKLLSDADEIEDPGKLLTDNDEADLDLSRNSKDDSMSPVLRSTSDACKITPEAARKRRERKERPYKSDPFSGTEIIPASKRCLLREERARLSLKRSQKSSSVGDDVIVFLDGVSQGELAHGDSFPSLEELNEDDEQPITAKDTDYDRSWKLKKHVSNVSSLSTDSGVIGQEGSHDSQQSSPSNTLKHSKSEYHERAWQRAMEKGMRVFSSSCSDLSRDQGSDCVDCVSADQVTIQQIINICPQCYQRRIERKKTIQEIMDTEINYGRDLTILKEEFYIPMMKAGLLNKDQLDSIFLNLDELIHVNKHFITKLKSSIHMANQHNDDDLQEVMIGNMFLESSTMFLTFENYCVNQAQAPILLESLEREKELLRIFLSVSQNDNHLLRRMHLKSFLMVPVQRIMRYPLLLDRLYKATPLRNRDKDHIKEAKDKIEDILGHINAKSRTASIKNRKSSEKHYSVTEKIEVSRVAIETLRWNRKDVYDVITSRLYVTQPVDHMWALKRCKNYKFTTVHGVLLSLVLPNSDNEVHKKQNTLIYSNSNNNNNNVSIQSAALVLIKEKNGKYQVLREPFMLENCVVSQDPDYIDVFEILEWNKEAFLFKAESPADTKAWIHSLRQQMHNLGCWRKRRNALPNILLNHLS